MSTPRRSAWPPSPTDLPLVAQLPLPIIETLTRWFPPPTVERALPPMVEVRAACGGPRDPARQQASQPHPPSHDLNASRIRKRPRYTSRVCTVEPRTHHSRRSRRPPPDRQHFPAGRDPPMVEQPALPILGSLPPDGRGASRVRRASRPGETTSLPTTSRTRRTKAAPLPHPTDRKSSPKHVVHKQN